MHHAEAKADLSVSSSRQKFLIVSATSMKLCHLMGFAVDAWLGADCWAGGWGHACQHDWWQLLNGEAACSLRCWGFAAIIGFMGVTQMCADA